MTDVAGAVPSGRAAEDSRHYISGAQRTSLRALFFILQHLALVIAAEAIVDNMHQAYERIKFDRPGFGAFIAGPSNNADIEQSLVIGAHGLRSLYVLCVGSRSLMTSPLPESVKRSRKKIVVFCVLTVIDDAVNVASRLQTYARHNEMCIDEETYAKTDRGVHRRRNRHGGRQKLRPARRRRQSAAGEVNQNRYKLSLSFRK